jgi:hypothetical protein
VQGTTVKINIRPPETEGFAFTQTHSQRDGVKRFETVSLNLLQECNHLFGGEVLKFGSFVLSIRITEKECYEIGRRNKERESNAGLGVRKTDWGL